MKNGNGNMFNTEMKNSVKKICKRPLVLLVDDLALDS